MGQIVQNPESILRNLDFILKQWEMIKQLQERKGRENSCFCFFFYITLAFEYIKGWKNEGYIIHQSNLSLSF